MNTAKERERVRDIKYCQIKVTEIAKNGIVALPFANKSNLSLYKRMVLRTQLFMFCVSIFYPMLFFPSPNPSFVVTGTALSNLGGNYSLVPKNELYAFS